MNDRISELKAILDDLEEVHSASLWLFDLISSDKSSSEFRGLPRSVALNSFGLASDIALEIFRDTGEIVKRPTVEWRSRPGMTAPAIEIVSSLTSLIEENCTRIDKTISAQFEVDDEEGPEEPQDGLEDDIVASSVHERSNAIKSLLEVIRGLYALRESGYHHADLKRRLGYEPSMISENMREGSYL